MENLEPTLSLSLYGSSQRILVRDRFARSDVSVAIQTYPVQSTARRVTVSLTPHLPVRIKAATLNFPFNNLRRQSVFCNGFQSWSESFVYPQIKKLPRLHPSIRPFYGQCGDEGLLKSLKCTEPLYSWSYTWIRRESGKPVLCGSLNEQSGYTLIAFDMRHNIIRVKKEVPPVPIENKRTLIDLYWDQGDKSEIFERYFRQMGITPKKRKCRSVSWNSWYNHFSDISEKGILRTCNELKKASVKPKTVLIDDGYQQSLGEWTTANDSFPSGMAYCAKRIREAGYSPGIWISPFIVERRSTLFRNHQEWLLRDRKKRPVTAGYNRTWGGFYYILDFFHPAVRQHLAGTFETLIDAWGYETIKVDYLYAPSLIPQKGYTRGAIQHEVTAFIQTISRNARLIMCGTPLFPALGRCDLCRIGNDIGLRWEKSIARFLGFRERISTRASVHNTLLRADLDGYGFHNDPDVFLLRQNNNDLTPAQRKSLFTINALFGTELFTSDELQEYGDKENRLVQSLARYQNIVWKDIIFKKNLCIIKGIDGEKPCTLLFNPNARQCTLMPADTKDTRFKKVATLAPFEARWVP